ncbi:MAG: hypothetical protein M3O36_20025, partial [Myxococcota bacterium]|nr:hypothetical protein [Myxococcota bacterium]
VISNVARDDYAGSSACASCHPDISAAWKRSPMHRMTRDANAAGGDVRASFDGTRWRFRQRDEVVLQRSGGDRFVRVQTAGGQAKTYRVTRIIGGRTREDFAGTDVEDPAGGELVLPVSFVFATRALRYKGYSVMVHERASLRAGPSWSKTCLFCHNTVPEVDRLLGALGGAGSQPYQGETVDRWLPLDRRANVRVSDERGFARVLNLELARLGSPAVSGGARAIARAAIESVRTGFDGAALVEVGIGCEACHGGAREHAGDPSRRTSRVPTAPWLESTRMAATSAQAINHACARCHQVLFSRYPFTWEGGRRDANAGGSHINSGEGRDFLLGACAKAMSCTSCHDPHAGSDRQKLQALATPSGNATCTVCHGALSDSARLRAHAHHDPAGAGGSCIACHMPRKNMGLDGTLTRYHRIGSPTDPARVLGDRPLECALCHADKSVAALVASMEAWWRVRFPRPRLEELYGSLDANVMRATLERGKPHERVVAMAVLGEARDRSSAALVGRELLGEYPLAREWARRALVSILGRCDVDLSGADEAIAREAQACVGGPLAPLQSTPGQPLDEEPED